MAPLGINTFLLGAKTSPHKIEQSLRFNSADSTNLSRTPSSTGNRKTFTVSCWVKRAQIGATQMIWSAGPASGGNIYLYFTSSDELQLSVDTEASGIVKTTQKFRDASAWYHIVCAVDTSQATAANRVKFFINGEAVSSFASASYPSQNHDTHWNHTSAHRIGQRNDGTAFYINAYIAEFYNLDGTAVSDAEDFAEADDNGVWVPIKYSGSYGTNGFYLKFDETATNGIGHDHSGNGNNWTASGFVTSGTGTDVFSDTPTTNWATLNAVDKASNHTLSEGNLKITQGSTTDNNTASTIAVSSGKWYFEVEITNHAGSTSYDIGVGKDLGRNTVLGNNATSYAYSSSGNKRTNSTNSSYGDSFTTGDIVSAAFDADNGTLTFYKNGVSQGEAFTGLTDGPYHFLVGTYVSGDVRTVNFGQRDFAYTPPTGFKALSTKNLPAPTVKDGSDYFNTVLYTADGVEDTAITVGFQPDWVWGKARNQSFSHALFDSLRGPDERLMSNSSNGEDQNAQYLKSFDANGFTLGTDDNMNYNTATMVAWCWKGGNTTGVSNTDGTITSTVSANPTAGFSIIAYTGNGSNTQTVGHGLGVAPSMCIGKSRAANSWFIRHESLGSNLNLNFNDSGTVTPGGGGLIGDLTSSTTISLPGGSNAGSGNMNASGTNYIMYCFAEVENYSRMGSYTGNGNADGPFVHCGFRPAWILIKRVGSGDWILQDSKRLGYNVDNNDLIPNQNYSEATDDRLDQLSNGFKLRSTFTTSNASGGTYVFIAFAENPVGGDGASPATAR